MKQLNLIFILIICLLVKSPDVYSQVHETTTQEEANEKLRKLTEEFETKKNEIATQKAIEDIQDSIDALHGDAFINDMTPTQLRDAQDINMRATANLAREADVNPNAQAIQDLNRPWLSKINPIYFLVSLFFILIICALISRKKGG